MTKTEHLYANLPVYLQTVICTADGARTLRYRYGGAYFKLLAAAEERATWSAADVMNFRDQRLVAFATSAVKECAFYRQWSGRLGTSRDDVKAVNVIEELPVLTKKHVKENIADFGTAQKKNEKRSMIHTSGTTGGGLRFAATRSSIQAQWAIWWRYRRWHKIPMGTWCAYFGGRSIVPPEQSQPPFWRYSMIGRQILFSGYHLNEANAAEYCTVLRKRRPPWLHGYPSMLTLLASYIVDRGIDLGYTVRWVTTGAENLSPRQRKLLEQAFGVKPRQHYGMAEAAANFSECDAGRLHIDEDFAYVELLPTADGNTHRIVGTNYSNRAMPLLRYDIGDLATPSPETNCPCGRPGRLVESVDGRQEDYVILTNGARVGRLDHMFKDLVNIREAQIFQRQVGEVIVRVIPGNGYSERDEQLLRDEFYTRLGPLVSVKVDYVTCIPRTQRGKLRLVISELSEGQIDTAVLA